MFSKSLIASAFAAVCTSITFSAAAQVPAGYPADYAKIVDSAKKEGTLVVYAATDTKEPRRVSWLRERPRDIAML